MTATITDVVRQFKRDWTSQLEPSAITQACREVGHVWRERVLTPIVTMQLFFVQVLHGNTACSHLRHLTKLPATAEAYCQARMKLPLAVFQILLRAVSGQLHQGTLDDGRWLGHRTFFADGSSFSMPDTPVLQSCFGQPGQQQPGCGFPVAHLMALFHAGTGMVLDVLTAPLRTHDMSRAALLHPELQTGDILVADRAFCSYAHLALLLQRGAHGCLRMHQQQIVDFTPGRPYAMPSRGKSQHNKGKPRSRWLRRLGKLDQVVEWLKPINCPTWMPAEQFAALPDSIEIRELRYRVGRKGFRVKEITLATTLLDCSVYTLSKLADLYYARWRIETNFAHLKTTMGLDVLKCKTVDGVRKELIVFALVYNLVRLVMLAAAGRQKVDVERISFIDAARWLAAAAMDEPLGQLVVNPHRPNRYEPRVRKRRPKQYPLMTKPRKILRNLLLDKEDSN
jgi:hypothetical protein